MGWHNCVNIARGEGKQGQREWMLRLAGRQGKKLVRPCGQRNADGQGGRHLGVLEWTWRRMFMGPRFLEAAVRLPVKPMINPVQIFNDHSSERNRRILRPVTNNAGADSRTRPSGHWPSPSPSPAYWNSRSLAARYFSTTCADASGQTDPDRGLRSGRLRRVSWCAGLPICQRSWFPQGGVFGRRAWTSFF